MIRDTNVYGSISTPTAVVDIAVNSGKALTITWISGGINFVRSTDSRFVNGGLMPGGRATACPSVAHCGCLKILIGGVEAGTLCSGGTTTVNTTGYNGTISLLYIDDGYADNPPNEFWKIRAAYGNC